MRGLGGWCEQHQPPVSTYRPPLPRRRGPSPRSRSAPEGGICHRSEVRSEEKCRSRGRITPGWRERRSRYPQGRRAQEAAVTMKRFDRGRHWARDRPEGGPRSDPPGSSPRCSEREGPTSQGPRWRALVLWMAHRYALDIFKMAVPQSLCAHSRQAAFHKGTEVRCGSGSSALACC